MVLKTLKKAVLNPTSGLVIGLGYLENLFSQAGSSRFLYICGLRLNSVKQINKGV